MNELLKLFIIMGQGVASGFDMFENDIESKHNLKKIIIQFVVELVTVCSPIVKIPSTIPCACLNCL